MFYTGSEEGPFILSQAYGVCVVSDDGRRLTFPTTGGDCVLDGVTGKLSRPVPLPDS